MQGDRNHRPPRQDPSDWRNRHQDPRSRSPVRSPSPCPSWHEDWQDRGRYSRPYRLHQEEGWTTRTSSLEKDVASDLSTLPTASFLFFSHLSRAAWGPCSVVWLDPSFLLLFSFEHWSPTAGLYPGRPFQLHRCSPTPASIVRGETEQSNSQGHPGS
jgi:hypothetical protein